MLFWKEVFITFREADYRKCVDLLREQGIPFRTKVDSMRDRMATGVSLGENPAALHDCGGLEHLKCEYRIFVKKKDVELAKHIL